MKAMKDMAALGFKLKVLKSGVLKIRALTISIVITSTLLIGLPPLTALADDDREQDQALKLRQQGLILPLEKILQAAQQAHPGRVVEVELQREHKKYIYEVELVDSNGQVWEMKLDATSARIIESERED